MTCSKNLSFAGKTGAEPLNSGDTSMRFRLSPPGWPVLLVSLLLAGLAIATLYFKVPWVGVYVKNHRFWVLVAAYAILLMGVVLEGL